MRKKSSNYYDGAKALHDLLINGDIEAATDSMLDSEAGARSTASCYEHMLRETEEEVRGHIRF